MDYQHHTNKATAERTQGEQERTLTEEENERITDKGITHAEEEEDEAEIKDTGSRKRVLVRVVLNVYLLLLSLYVEFLVLNKNLTILSESKGM